MATKKENRATHTKALSLLRDDLLPLLLDEDEEAILYWAGKELSRKHPQETEEDVKTFFSDYQLGSLSLKEEKSSESILTLQGPAVESRFETSHPGFFLEAGLAAGFYQMIHQVYAEAKVDILTNKKIVEIIIFYDQKEIIDS